MSDKDLRSVAKSIEKGDDFLVISHVNPEGDAIGSQLAVGSLLEKLGKRFCMVNADIVPGNLMFLHDSDKVKRSVPEDFSPKTVIVLDCPVAARCGNLTEFILLADNVINIDHHCSNDNFGDVNWIAPNLSSAGEMVFDLFQFMGIELDKRTAEKIYVAIVTDTGVFSYENTTEKTHLTASRLLAAGVEQTYIQKKLFESRSVQQVALLGKVLTTLEVTGNGSIAHISLMQNMCIGLDMNKVSTEDFISYPRSIKGVKVALFFKEVEEEADVIRISFRSNGIVDVNSIASRFGGGGHRLASGCTVHGSLETVKRDIIEYVEKDLEKI